MTTSQALLVDRQEVDPALAVVPLSELLGEDVEVVPEDLDLRPEEPLDVGSLPDSHVSERLLGDGPEGTVGHFVEGHGDLVKGGNEYGTITLYDDCDALEAASPLQIS